MTTDLFPASFWPLALAHALALLSPGPDFMLIVSHSVRHRLGGGVFICLGIALGNAVYVTLAIVGWTGVRDHAILHRGLEMAGVAYLAWLGWRLLGSRRRDGDMDTGESTVRASPVTQLSLGLGSALLNPKNMVFYLAIMTVLIEAEARVEQRIAAGIWMCCVVLIWDVLVAAAISLPWVRGVLWRRIHVVEKACGCFFLFVSVSLLVAPWL